MLTSTSSMSRSTSTKSTSRRRPRRFGQTMCPRTTEWIRCKQRCGRTCIVKHKRRSVTPGSYSDKQSSHKVCTFSNHATTSNTCSSASKMERLRVFINGVIALQTKSPCVATNSSQMLAAKTSRPWIVDVTFTPRKHC